MNKGDLIPVTDDNFEDEVLKADKPALVDFWAPWCGPCNALAPVIEEIAGDYKETVKVAKMNVEDYPKTAQGYGIRGIPTILLFKDGELKETIVGLVPKESLEEAIKKVL